MEHIEPGKTFVRYLAEGKREQAYLAVVTGVLGKDGESLTICFLGREGSRDVRRDECVPILPSSVRGGLINFSAHHPSFGCGVIAAEEVIDGLLYVDLYRDGKYSGLEPITDITLTCS